MKKTTTILLSLVIALSLIACNGDQVANASMSETTKVYETLEQTQEPTPEPTSEPTPEPTPQVDAWEMLKEYIAQNGEERKEYNDVIFKQTNADEALGDVSLIYKNETDQIVIGSTLFQQDNNIWTAYSTSFTLIKDSDECKFLTQLLEVPSLMQICVFCVLVFVV